MCMLSGMWCMLEIALVDGWGGGRVMVGEG